LLRLVKGTAKLNTCCGYGWIDSSRRVAISNLPPICSLKFNFMDGVGEKKITKLGCEKYFCRATY
jgi:hypothetical protein